VHIRICACVTQGSDHSGQPDCSAGVNATEANHWQIPSQFTTVEDTGPYPIKIFTHSCLNLILQWPRRGCL